MISIITAIHNQLPMNRIFWHYLKKHTAHPFELIVIDNNSNDGSAEFFEQMGAVVIRNKANYSYPYTQNQGVAVAQYDVYAFLNNDIIVAPNWDRLLLESMRVHNLNIITVCGIERVETLSQTKAMGRKWKRIKNVTQALFGINGFTLRLMLKLMYQNWERFSTKRQQQFAQQVVEGFVGNSVVYTRKAAALIGNWDERIQEADFDLYMRSKKRAMEIGDIQPCHIALDVFHHHYIRITAKAKPPVFADADTMIPLSQKWTEAERKLYLKDNVFT